MLEPSVPTHDAVDDAVDPVDERGCRDADRIVVGFGVPCIHVEQHERTHALWVSRCHEHRNLRPGRIKTEDHRRAQADLVADG